MVASHFRLFHHAIFLALGWVSILAWPLRAETVTLLSVADTFLPEFDEHFPGANGSGPDMVIGTQGVNAFFARNRGLIRFDLSSIPMGAEVNSVTLQLTVNRVPTAGVASDFQLHRLRVSWAESESTWFLRRAGETWGTPGGEAGTDYSTIVSAQTLVNGQGTILFGSTPALLEDVTGWLNLPASNQGWLIKTEDESVKLSAGRFASKETAASGPG